VSGGPDSLAMLLLACAGLPHSFVVVTVDHGLRSESAIEAAGVAQLCAGLGIQHALLTLELASGPALQERARTARYHALGRWARESGLAAIATAHHADDQAETVLMRLARGAGVRGLAAMRRRAVVPGVPDCTLLRPLLGWKRSELGAIVATAGIRPVLDPSNTDLRFERARLRSLLGAVPGFDGAALAASAHHLAEADAGIEWAAERCFADVVVQAGALHWAPADTPRVIVMRVLERVVARFGGTAPRGSALARWHDQLAAGGIATLAGIRGDGRKPQWRFELAAARRH